MFDFKGTRLSSAFGRCMAPSDRSHRAARGPSSIAAQLKFGATDEMIEVELERSAPMPLKKLPAWTRVLSGKQQTMRHHSRWQRAGRKRINAELDISPVGVPLDAHCTGSVVEVSPGLSRMTLRFEVNCNAPMVGTDVARFYAEQVKEALRADHAFTLCYLEAIGTPAGRKV